MDLIEFYKNINGNYEDAKNRLMTEELMLRFINKFADSDDMSLMKKSIDEELWEDAFRYSHNLKGVSLNLGFTKLAQSACDLCETMRNGKPTKDNSQLLNIVISDYNTIIDEIKKL